jgi:hypothetical protein
MLFGYNTDSICQAKGERGQAPVPTPTLETNKAFRLALHIANVATISSFCHNYINKNKIDQKMANHKSN